MLFIHLSDIHFKEKEVFREDDPNAGLRDDLLQDVKYMKEVLKRSADAVLISGDIAYSGLASEYDFAHKWLEESLCPAAGCSIENVFVIPGNHDVDRSKTSTPMHRDARTTLRNLEASEVDGRVREYLTDKFSADLLFSPIENYNRFAAKFLCSIGAYDKGRPEIKPFAVRSWPMNDGSILKIWGFNSVLISDAQDKLDSMFVDPAGSQIIRQDGVVHVVMCHHPYSWLKNGANFRERIEEVAHLHLFGHEHSRRIEPGLYFTTIRAGAVQPDRDEAGWDPGYNWIDVNIFGSKSDRQLQIDVRVRKREGARFIAVPDRDHKDTWTVRHKLPAWSAPVAATQENKVTSSPVNAPSAPEIMPPAISKRSVVSKLFKLSEHSQRQIILELSLDQDGDQGLRDYELVLAAVHRASDRNKLADLDEKANAALEELH